MRAALAAVALASIAQAIPDVPGTTKPAAGSADARTPGCGATPPNNGWHNMIVPDPLAGKLSGFSCRFRCYGTPRRSAGARSAGARRWCRYQSRARPRLLRQSSHACHNVETERPDAGREHRALVPGVHPVLVRSTTPQAIPL
eukprot:SAG11_NODE_5584_length_1517_cov_2.247532_2_plen_143_part_00